ncbi:MAG: CDP-alcohol phosphatidyltransferase family protein [Rhizobiaceae bacterium]
MLDGVARKAIDPILDRLGSALARSGATANAVSLAGFALGVLATIAIASAWWWTGAVLILLSRLCDGLDGVVARQKGATDFGGYLDIVLDFAFYGMIPFAFALADPPQNALPAAALILSFYINGASFLAYAILAEKHKLTEVPRGKKSIFFTTGLAEASETLAVFTIACVKPDWFPVLAYGFAAICFWTAVNRILEAKSRFG